MAKKIVICKLYNCSKQMLCIQVRNQNADFYTSEQQIRLHPGKEVSIPKDHLLIDQINNLQQRGMIRSSYSDE